MPPHTTNVMDKTDEVGGYDFAAVPTKPNTVIFQQLEGKKIHHVACGNDTTFCIASDDTVGSSLGKTLYNECQIVVNYEEDEVRST